MLQPVQEIPTIGLFVETAQYKNIELTVFDLGGANKIWALWRHYYERTDGAIFVIDSLDKERCEIAAAELHRMSSEILADKPILIFANKQDLVGAMNLEEIRRNLRLETLKQKHWHIQPCCAIQGDGLDDGFSWIDNICKKQ